jgi:hypothetical protein
MRIEEETDIKKPANSLKISLQNLGTVNKNEVVLTRGKKRLVLTFSYEIIVSFNISTPDYYRRETIRNYWSNTTGKLLNEVCSDKSLRLSREDFGEALNLAFKKFEVEEENPMHYCLSCAFKKFEGGLK